MNNETDRLLLAKIINTPEAMSEMSLIYKMLDESISQSRFNLERAEEMFLFFIDNCAYRFCKGYPGGASVLFPKTIRRPFATELTQEYVRARNGVKSQRPVRRGLFRYLFGK